MESQVSNAWLSRGSPTLVRQGFLEELVLTLRQSAGWKLRILISVTGCYTHLQLADYP